MYIIKRKYQEWWFGPNSRIVYDKKDALQFKTFSGTGGALIVQKALGTGWEVEEVTDATD